MLKFTRSLSMPDTSKDIPPHPGISPPSPPYNISAPIARVYEPNQSIYLTERGLTINKGMGGYHQQNSKQYDFQSPSGTLPNRCAHNRAHVPDNPYSDISIKTLSVLAKPACRKGTLVKQPNVENSSEMTCSIPIPTIIVKEPSTSSSGKSSQGSSIEIDTSDQLRPEDSLIVSNPFAAAIAGAVRDREKRLEARRHTPAFLSMDFEDEDLFVPTPCLWHSMSIGEGMFDDRKSLQELMAPPTSLGGSNKTEFNIPKSTTDPPNAHTEDYPTMGCPVDGGMQHLMTEKTLDSSPLAIGLAASDTMKNKASPPKGDLPKADLDQPLFIDTKLQSNFAVTAAIGQPKDCGGLLRSSTENNHETENANERNQLEHVKNTHNMSQKKSAGLLMVHNVAKPHVNNHSELKQESVVIDSIPNKQVDTNFKHTVPYSQPSHQPHTGNNLTSATVMGDSVMFSFRIPPPPVALMDIDEEFDLAESLPPPLEFANSIDIPEDHVAEILKQKNCSIKDGLLLTNHSHARITAKESKCLSMLLKCMSPYGYPPPPQEIFEPVTDSGIEEVESRSSGDPPFEVTSTISTVSSISTLSSEGIEALDLCTVYANEQSILMDRPQVPPKTKIKTKSNALYKDPFIFTLQPPPAPPLGFETHSKPHKTSIQGGSNHKNPFLSHRDPKASVISELSSKLQQMNNDKHPRQEGALDSLAASRVIGSRESAVQAADITSCNTMKSTAANNFPPQASSETCLPGIATSSTLTDVFSIPTPPIVNAEQCCSSVSSPSTSSLAMFQVASIKPFSSKPMLCWSKHDVAEWLESLNLEEHRKAFLDNEIEGTHLANLQKEDLIDLGVMRVGHRINIERALKLLMNR